MLSAVVYCLRLRKSLYLFSYAFCSKSSCSASTISAVSINQFSQNMFICMSIWSHVRILNICFAGEEFGMKKRNNLVSKNMGKSRTTIKEPKLLIITNRTGMYFHKLSSSIFNCIKAVNRNKLMLQNPGSSFVILFIAITGSKKRSWNRNHYSNATGDISVWTRREEIKQCSFNAYF